MREILFRGKWNGEWVYGGYCESPTKWLIIEISETMPTRIEGKHVIPETVGQYTGLTDMNGKKIFEGDIVKVERDLWHGENKKEREIFNGVVWYDEKHTCFGLKSEKYKCLPIARFKGDYSTVIGNIHDNPELLKGE